MKKTLKTVILIAVVLALIGLAVGGYFIDRHKRSYIGRDEAMRIALLDSGIEKTMLKDTDTDFEHSRYVSFYDLEFETLTGEEYDYTIDAVTGEILCRSVKGK